MEALTAFPAAFSAATDYSNVTTSLPTPAVLELPAVRSWLDAYIASPFLSWTLVPLLASFIGFSVTCACLEWVLRQPWSRKYHIEYGEARQTALDKVYKHTSWWAQLKRTLLFVGGPYTLIGYGLHTIIFPLCIPQAASALPTLPQLLVEFGLLMIAADFFLYWGHRAAHEVPFLWEHHKVHHMIQTPTPVSTAFISTIDAFVHAGPPMTLCALAVRPHPMCYAVYIGWHLANAAHNHSGMDCWWLNFSKLSFLPLRTNNAHHDAHHRFANYGPWATNYGDTFVVWDFVFRSVEAQRPDSAAQKAKRVAAKKAL